MVINGTHWNINFMRTRTLFVLNGGDTIINKTEKVSNVYSVNE